MFPNPASEMVTAKALMLITSRHSLEGAPGFGDTCLQISEFSANNHICSADHIGPLLGTTLSRYAISTQLAPCVDYPQHRAAYAANNSDDSSCQRDNLYRRHLHLPLTLIINRCVMSFLPGIV